MSEIYFQNVQIYSLKYLKSRKKVEFEINQTQELKIASHKNVAQGASLPQDIWDYVGDFRKILIFHPSRCGYFQSILCNDLYKFVKIFKIFQQK